MCVKVALQQEIFCRSQRSYRRHFRFHRALMRAAVADDYTSTRGSISFFETKTIMRTTFAAFILLSSTCFAQVSIAGDDTLILLGQRISQVYRQSDPSAQVSVAGRSGSARAQIIQSNRKPAGRSFPVAIQSAVIYVNKSNPVSELTVAQVRAIFMGEITNWKAVGGKDAQIKLYAGESTSGTLAFFQEVVLRGQEPYPFWGKSTTKELVETIAADPDSIGYASFSPSKAVKPIKVKAGNTSLAIEPSMDNIRSMRYPLARYLYWGVKENPQAVALASWLLSSQGQLVIESVGFEPITAEQRNTGRAVLRKPGSSPGNPAAH
jgi:phosphate transport system substrate-binding protein